MPTLLDIPASLDLDFSDLMPAAGPEQSAVGEGAIPPGATSSTTPAGILQNDRDALPGTSANGSKYGPDHQGDMRPATPEEIEAQRAGMSKYTPGERQCMPIIADSAEELIPPSAAGDTVLADVGDRPCSPVISVENLDYSFPVSPEAARLAEIIDARRRADAFNPPASLMTLRDWFVGQLLAAGRLPQWDNGDRLEQAIEGLYRAADALLEERAAFEEKKAEREATAKREIEQLAVGIAGILKKYRPAEQPTSPPPTEAPADGVIVLDDDSPYPGLHVGKPTEADLEIARKLGPELQQLAAESLESAGDPDAWRYHKIDELGLKPSLTERLTNEAIVTIGQLEDLRAEIASGSNKWPKGIGPAKVTEIENAVVKWLARWHEKHQNKESEDSQ